MKNEEMISIPKELFDLLLRYHINGERSIADIIEPYFKDIMKKRTEKIIISQILREDDPKKRENLRQLYDDIKSNSSVTIEIPRWMISDRKGERGDFYSIQLADNTLIYSKNVGGYRFTVKDSNCLGVDDTHGYFIYSNKSKITLRKYDKNSWDVIDEIKLPAEELKAAIEEQKEKYISFKNEKNNHIKRKKVR